MERMEFEGPQGPFQCVIEPEFIQIGSNPEKTQFSLHFYSDTEQTQVFIIVLPRDAAQCILKSLWEKLDGSGPQPLIKL